MNNNNIYTNKLGIARSLIALALLVTLLTCNKDILFVEALGLTDHSTFIEKINLFMFFGYENLYISYSIAITVLSLAVIGVYPRITGIFHWWVTFSFFTSSIIIEGGDQIAQIFTFFFIPITLLDNRKSHFATRKNISDTSKNISDGIWFILKIQAALLYLEAGIGKIYSSIEWADGTALYYWINNNLFGRGDALVDLMNTLMESPYLTFILSYSVIILEIILFGALFSGNQKFKNWLFWIALSFHFSIVIYFGLFSFFLNMSGVLIIYLLDIKQPLNFEKFKSHLNKVNTQFRFSFKR